MLKTKNSLFLIFLLLLFSQILKAQSNHLNFDPEILILAPANIVIAPTLAKEVQAQNDSIKKMLAQFKDQIDQTNDRPANISMMTKNSQLFLKHLDFFKQISFVTYNFLVYKFYEHFPNVLVMLKDTTIDASINSFQQVAKKEKMPYIVNFSKVELVDSGGQKTSKISVQLYELESNSLLIDKTYTGDMHNHGFETACEDGTLSCTLINGVSSSLNEIIKQIAANNNTLKKEQALELERGRILRTQVFPVSYDATLLKQIIPVSDSSINMKALYQCIYNADRTQFVAFFTEAGISKNFKSLHDKIDKGKVEIITSKDIRDSGYLDDIPKTYAYLVKGVKYNDKWYYEKDQITYFDAPSLKDGRSMYFNRLSEWGYFKDDSSEYSSGFWSNSLFEKIADRTKDPKWEKYKDMWATEERENRDYIGMFEFVAEKMKHAKKEETEKYQHSIAATLRSFFDAQIKKGNPDFLKYESIDKNFVLIYPKNRNVVLVPLKVTNKEPMVRFYLYVSATKQVYEWTYFLPQALVRGYTDESISNALKSLTNWDFSYNTLDDIQFWEKSVLLKENGTYKYLKELK